MNNKFFRVIGILALGFFASTASANLLADPSFEAMDSSGGDVGCAGTFGPWGCFNNSFVSSQAITPHSGPGTNAIKQWGVDAGVFQDVAVTAGTTYDTSVYAANWNGDLMLGVGVFQLSFKDAGGNIVGGVAETRCGNASSTEVCQLAGVDGGDPSMWTLLEMPGLVAPAGAVTATLLLLHLDGGGGAIFWDDATLTARPVPVPGALLLMGPALLGLIGFGRKRA